MEPTHNSVKPCNEAVNSKLNVVTLVVTSGQAMSQLTDRH